MKNVLLLKTFLVVQQWSGALAVRAEELVGPHDNIQNPIVQRELVMRTEVNKRHASLSSDWSLLFLKNTDLIHPAYVVLSQGGRITVKSEALTDWSLDVKNFEECKDAPAFRCQFKSAKQTLLDSTDSLPFLSQLHVFFNCCLINSSVRKITCCICSSEVPKHNMVARRMLDFFGSCKENIISVQCADALQGFAFYWRIKNPVHNYL